MFAMRSTGYQSCANSVQKEDFREEEAIHIVYVMCGEERSDEFMASLKSLHLFAKVALQADQNYFHIHVITADTVSFSFMHYPCISPCLSVCTHLPDSFCCFTAAAQALQIPSVHEMCHYVHIQRHASSQNGTEEVGGLQPRSNFRLTFHKMVMDAPELFGPCAMQTLYIHESAEFNDIDQAIAVAPQACAEERSQD